MLPKTVVVFGGAECAEEKRDFYFSLAYRTGKLLAEQEFVVASGAGPGLMDEVLRGAKEGKGKTIGIGLNLSGRKQSEYADESALFDDLRARQSKLIELGDAYVVLPGGVGTLAEVGAVLAAKRVGEMTYKPMVFVGKYYRVFESMIEKMIQEGLAQEEVRGYYALAETPEEGVKIVQEQLLLEKKYFEVEKIK